MIDYEAFFRVMKIREEQIKRRIQTALELEDEFMYLLSEIKWSQNEIALKRRVGEFTARLERYVSDKINAPMFAAEYAEKVADDVYARTMGRINELKEQGKYDPDDTPYILSIDRASLLAAGAALAIWAHKEYIDAYADGYTRKTWVCMMDGKERESHARVNGTTVGIDKYFRVGNSDMLYPCDPQGDISETAQCRCWLEYSGRGEPYEYEKPIEELKEGESGGTISDEPPVVFRDEKLLGWLLSPDGRHYREFIDIGYSPDDPERLRKDILSTYREVNLNDTRTTIKGTTYSYRATLGVTKERLFNIVWGKDDDESLPHFVTAYRVSDVQ